MTAARDTREQTLLDLAEKAQYRGHWSGLREPSWGAIFDLAAARDRWKAWHARKCDEVDRLTAELAESHKDIEIQRALLDAADAAVRQANQLREALEFYAKERTWDHGKLARAALAAADSETT